MSGIRILEELEQNLCNLSSLKVAQCDFLSNPLLGKYHEANHMACQSHLRMRQGFPPAIFALMMEKCLVQRINEILDTVIFRQSGKDSLSLGKHVIFHSLCTLFNAQNNEV